MTILRTCQRLLILSLFMLTAVVASVTGWLVWTHWLEQIDQRFEMSIGLLRAGLSFRETLGLLPEGMGQSSVIPEPDGAVTVFEPYSNGHHWYCVCVKLTEPTPSETSPVESVRVYRLRSSLGLVGEARDSQIRTIGHLLMSGKKCSEAELIHADSVTQTAR